MRAMVWFLRSWWMCLLVLGLTARAEAAVRLDWDYTQGTEPATKFTVYRQPSCTGPFAKLAEVTPVGTAPATYTYRDTTAAVGQTYCWHVKAATAAGKESAASNVAQFRVPGVVAAPVNLRVIVE